MQGCGVVIYASTVQPNEALHVPSGWFVAESCLNNTDMGGMRWLVVTKQRSAEMDSLIAKLMPADISKVKASSSLGFLLKLIDAQQQVSHPDSVSDPSKTLKTITAGTLPISGKLQEMLIAIKCESSIKRDASTSSMQAGLAIKGEPVTA
jgi:hypothetical protein